MTNACKIFCVTCLYANKICKSVIFDGQLLSRVDFPSKKIPKLDSSQDHSVVIHRSNEIIKVSIPLFTSSLRNHLNPISRFDSFLFFSLKIVKPFNYSHNVSHTLKSSIVNSQLNRTRYNDKRNSFLLTENFITKYSRME